MRLHQLSIVQRHQLTARKTLRHQRGWPTAVAFDLVGPRHVSLCSWVDGTGVKLAEKLSSTAATFPMQSPIMRSKTNNSELLGELSTHYEPPYGSLVLVLPTFFAGRFSALAVQRAREARRVLSGLRRFETCRDWHGGGPVRRSVRHPP